MTLTIELTPEQEARLNRTAQKKGVLLADVVRDLLENLPEGEETATQQTAKERSQRLRDLFAEWEQQNEQRRAAMTPEQIAQEDARAEEALRNIQEGGLTLPVPDVTTHA